MHVLRAHVLLQNPSKMVHDGKSVKFSLPHTENPSSFRQPIRKIHQISAPPIRKIRQVFAHVFVEAYTENPSSFREAYTENPSSFRGCFRMCFRTCFRRGLYGKSVKFSCMFSHVFSGMFSSRSSSWVPPISSFRKSRQLAMVIASSRASSPSASQIHVNLATSRTIPKRCTPHFTASLIGLEPPAGKRGRGDFQATHGRLRDIQAISAVASAAPPLQLRSPHATAQPTFQLLCFLGFP